MLNSCDEAETSRGLCNSLLLPLEEVTYCKQSNNASYEQPVKVLWEDAAFDTNGIRLSAKKKVKH